MSVPGPRQPLTEEQRTHLRDKALARSQEALDRIEEQGPRSLVELTTLLSRRVVRYRLALVDIGLALRPDHCLGCRVVGYILNDIDNSR